MSDSERCESGQRVALNDALYVAFSINNDYEEECDGTDDKTYKVEGVYDPPKFMVMHPPRPAGDPDGPDDAPPSSWRETVPVGTDHDGEDENDQLETRHAAWQRGSPTTYRRLPAPAFGRRRFLSLYQRSTRAASASIPGVRSSRTLTEAQLIGPVSFM